MRLRRTFLPIILLLPGTYHLLQNIKAAGPAVEWVEERMLCTTPSQSWCIYDVTPMDIADNTKRLDSLCPPAQNDQPPLDVQAPTPVETLLNWRGAMQQAEAAAAAAGRPGYLLLTKGHPFNAQLDKPKRQREPSIISLGHTHVGGYNETQALFRAMLRCRHHFSVVRYGDGELALMRRLAYTGEESLIEGNDGLAHTEWKFDPESEGADMLVELLYGAFELAAEQTEAHTELDENAIHRNRMFLGVPLYFCREGMTSTAEKPELFGGGGRSTWLEAFLTYKGKTLGDKLPGIGRKADLMRIPQQQIVYSWQWGNLNYQATLNMLQEIRNAGTRIVVICSDVVTKQDGGAPAWASAVLTVPGAGIKYFQKEAAAITRSATELAQSVRDHVFIIAAGPIAKAIIPLMNRANPSNTYLDVGGSLDSEILGLRTRAFQHEFSTTGYQTWVQAGGAVTQGQKCTETRWDIRRVSAERAEIEYVQGPPAPTPEPQATTLSQLKS